MYTQNEPKIDLEVLINQGKRSPRGHKDSFLSEVPGTHTFPLLFYY